MVLCQDTDQGTGTLCSHCCRDQTVPGAEMFPLGHGQLLEMSLGLVERPSANIGEAGSTLRHGGISPLHLCSEKQLDSVSGYTSLK